MLHSISVKYKTNIEILNGEVAIAGNKIPRLVLLGIAGVILLYAASAGIVSSATPWNIGGDTRSHMDYVWRVYNGETPKFNDGITHPILSQQGSDRVQQAAANPPLYYYLHAPFIGHMLDTNNMKEAYALGKAINILIGVLCVLALAWGGWTLGGKKRNLMAIATPQLGVMSYRFLTQNIIFGLDSLVVLFATLSLIIIHKMLVNGPTLKYLSLLSLLSILGMLTKAPYIVIVAVCCLGIIISYLKLARINYKTALAKGSLAVLGLLLVTIIFTGWYYYGNYASTGNWYSASPPGFTGGREYKSFSDVISSSRLWSLFYVNSSSHPLLVTSFTSFVIAGYLTIRYRFSLRYILKHKNTITMALMVVLFVGVFATQLRLATGYGSINFRYLLPALLPVSLFWAYGLLAFKQMRGLLVSIFGAAMAFATVAPFAMSSKIEGLVPAVNVTDNSITRLYIVAEANGIPSVVVSLMFISGVVGVLLVAMSLFYLTRQRRLLKIS